jgi:hypothetical protein
MNAGLTMASDGVQTEALRLAPKFNAWSLMEAVMIRNKKRSHSLPAIAFIYLALVGGLVLLTASRALAL